MTALAKLTALVGYTDSGYLDAHFDHDAGHDDIARAVYGEVLREAAGSVRTVAAQLGFPLDIVNMLCEDLDGEGAGQAGNDTAPSGGTTRTADLHGILLDSVRAFRINNDAPVSYNQQLANHILAAVAPLVPYREIWDSGLPPGGLCCSICGQPVESEPCPEHAPDYRTAVVEALRLLEAAPEAFQAAPSQNITAAAGVLRRAYEAGGGE